MYNLISDNKILQEETAADKNAKQKCGSNRRWQKEITDRIK